MSCGESSATLKCTMLAQSAQNYFLNTDLADVHFLFEIEQVRIPAHKMILAMTSPAFKTMFYGSIAEVGDIKIVDSSSEEFKEFLSTLYCANVIITAKNVGKVIYLAEKYFADSSLDVCDRFLDGLTTIDDILVGYDLSVQFNRTNLKKSIEEKINNQPKAVIRSDSFLKCSSDALKHIFQIDGLMCYAKELFDVCIKWTENACNINDLDPSDMQNRKKLLGESFYWIPFYMMKPLQIAQIAAEYKELFDRDELIDLLNIATADGPVASKKFKNKIDVVGKIDMRKFWWTTHLSKDNKQWIKNREIVNFEFYLNRKLVAIKPAIIFHNGTEESRTLSGILSIYQKGILGHDDEILLKQPIEIQCFKPYYSIDERIKLLKPIVLKSGQCKFQIDFDSSWQINTFFTKKIDDEDIFQFLYHGICTDTTS